MRVSFFQRLPEEGHTSVERVFTDVRKALTSDISTTVVISRFTSRGFLRRAWNTLEAAFKQGDVNHVTGDVHYLSLFLHKKKTLLTILDCVSLERLTGIRKIVFWFFWYWLPMQRAGAISVISQSTKEQLLRYVKYSPDKIHVIYCPCSEEFKTDYSEFNVERPRILQVGTGLTKNFERTVEALEGINCHLRIIGKLSETQLKKLVECNIDYSSVSNIPSKQMVQEYRECDILIFASTYEGFGLPIVEAQATGRPVIASKIYSMPEVAGSGACLVNPYDVQDIRRAIRLVIKDSDYRRKIVEQGGQNVKRFHPERITGEYIKIYRQLLGNT